MLRELKKLLKDTTQVAGNYVAKDVRNQVAFVNGLLLSYLASIRNSHIHNEYALTGAGILLSYSLGAAVVKSFYQYKNNQVANDASCPTEPSDETSVGAEANCVTLPDEKV